MPSSAAGWVNLSQYLGVNQDAGQQMAQAASDDVRRRSGQVGLLGRAVTGEAKRSGMQGGPTDLSKQGSYEDYAQAKAGLQDAASAYQNGQPGNPWDAAVSQPYWTAGKQAQGAYDRLAGAMGARQQQVAGSVAANQARRLAETRRLTGAQRLQATGDTGGRSGVKSRIEAAQSQGSDPFGRPGDDVYRWYLDTYGTQAGSRMYFETYGGGA